MNKSIKHPGIKAPEELPLPGVLESLDKEIIIRVTEKPDDEVAQIYFGSVGMRHVRRANWDDGLKVKRMRIRQFTEYGGLYGLEIIAEREEGAHGGF